MNNVPDIIAKDLDVLFCGINPGIETGRSGNHFAHPTNRFWTTLYAAGYTPHLMRPDEGHDLLDLGFGITNMAARTTTKASELSTAEVKLGWTILKSKLIKYRPKVLAICGITTYRTATGNRHAQMGLQDGRVNNTYIWVLPNPSGLNAHYTNEDFAVLFKEVLHFTQDLA